MFHIVQRRCGPPRRLELFLAELVEMGLKVLVLQLARLADLLLQLCQQIVVSPLLVLDERLVLQRSFEVHHGVAEQLLHLQRVEVLLVRDDVPQRGPHIFHLPELYRQHLVVLVEVFLYVVVRDPSRELVEHGFQPAVELRLESCNHLVVLAVGLGVAV